MPDQDQNQENVMPAAGSYGRLGPPDSVIQSRMGLSQHIGAAQAWNALTSDEKFERLRDCLRSKEMAISELREQVGKLMMHQHGENGQLLSPLFGYALPIGGGRYDPLE